MANPSLPPSPDRWQHTLNWQPTPHQHHQFQQLYAAILVGNRQFNLTRITEPDDFWEKHLWDSLAGIRSLFSETAPQRVIDMGTGAGFPGLPIAIAHPTWGVTLVDSTRKKIQFLEGVIQQLGLDKVSAIVGRAEQMGHAPPHREAYDLAVIRAVALAPICAEYLLPLVKVGGLAILYRGQWCEIEQEALTAALELLGGSLESVEAFQTPLTRGVRHCVLLRKDKPAPDRFPRGVGIPAQKPLG